MQQRYRPRAIAVKILVDLMMRGIAGIATPDLG